ncbi:DUF2963 domain-containing protein [Vaccinium witches'-broom phytoplasma]|uniref:DUF2963 domain-containing protein n=1 Tax=Vaccinium witches'-broom phytoplasma TaxID=85642 RepID=UPI0003718454|nr:DUF2963 domain-containing protein [Vaccinium witches'-broom phytoplasma]
MKTTKKEFIDNYGYKVIQEYDKDTGTSIKDIFYQLDGKTIHYIDEYDKATSNIIKKTVYRLDGKTIDYAYEYDKKYRNMFKYIEYQPDGITFKEKSEYDYDEEPITTTYYNLDGTISDIINF